MDWWTFFWFNSTWNAQFWYFEVPNTKQKLSQWFSVDFKLMSFPLYLTYNMQCWCAAEDFWFFLSVLPICKRSVGVQQTLKKVESHWTKPKCFFDICFVFSGVQRTRGDHWQAGQGCSEGNSAQADVAQAAAAAIHQQLCYSLELDVKSVSSTKTLFNQIRDFLRTS